MILDVVEFDDDVHFLDRVGTRAESLFQILLPLLHELRAPSPTDEASYQVIVSVRVPPFRQL